jgi:cysteinyl-tRNA synthetase
LKFPHHENEIAQSEAHNHTQLANYWMHCGFLLTNGVKMSKSLGNSILAKDVLERHSGNAIRLFFQTTHYRAPVNYTEENLNAMDKLAAKYENSLKRASVTLQLNNIPAGTRIASDYEEYMNALANDLNVANALSVIDREVKEINSLSAKKDGDMSRLADLVATISELYDILGLRFNLPVIGDEERKLLADFNLARENKDYTKSDELRPILMQKGLL